MRIPASNARLCGRYMHVPRANLLVLAENLRIRDRHRQIPAPNSRITGPKFPVSAVPAIQCWILLGGDVSALRESASVCGIVGSKKWRRNLPVKGKKH